MNPWSCPKCTCINTGDRCIACGERAPMGANQEQPQARPQLQPSPSQPNNRSPPQQRQPQNQLTTSKPNPMSLPQQRPNLSSSGKDEVKPMFLRSPSGDVIMAPRERTEDSARRDEILAELLAMNCGFSVDELADAVDATEMHSADRALAYLNGLVGRSSPVKSPIKSPPSALMPSTSSTALLSPSPSSSSSMAPELNDFVLREYIRDFAANTPDVLANVELFLVCMDSVNVKGMADRARAFALLELVKQEEQDQKFAAKLEQDNQASDGKGKPRGSRDGKPRNGEFECIGCTGAFAEGGAVLQNCPHFMCFPCLRTYIEYTALEIPACECGTEIAQSDIVSYSGAKRASEIAEKQTRKALAAAGARSCTAPGCNNLIMIEENVNCVPCSSCRSFCCFVCDTVHPEVNASLYRKYLERGMKLCPMELVRQREQLGIMPGIGDSVTKFWAAQQEECQLFDVAHNSPEWMGVMAHYRGGAREILSIQRIQNPRLWAHFSDYMVKMREQGFKVKEDRFWHGTRATHPRVIYAGKGFDMTHARVGGCLWFAKQSNYSMNGFQHPLPDGRQVVLQAVVACGNAQHVKHIRGDQILNVYFNACTYPAYEITYR